MTGRQIGRFNMYKCFIEFQNNYNSITNLLPCYNENFLLFKDAVIQLEQCLEEQSSNKTGITLNKNNQKLDLIEMTADYARKLRAYAKINENLVLEAQVKFGKGKLKQVSDIDVKEYAQIVYDIAQPLISSLSAYGINAANQLAFLDLINSFNACIGKPRLGIVHRSQATQRIANLFKLAEHALVKLDAVAEIVRLSEPEFYSRYKSNRKVIVYGTGKMAIKCKVSDAISNNAITGVIATFTHANSRMKIKPILKKTALKGGFNIKNMHEGTYIAKFEKVGYATHEQMVYVNSGEMTLVEVEMKLMEVMS